SLQAGVDQRGRGDEAVDEARACGVDVERTAADAELVLHRRGRGGQLLVGRGRRHEHEIDVRARDPGALQGASTGVDREPRRRTTDAALADARALTDPLVARVHGGGEVVVGDDLL